MSTISKRVTYRMRTVETYAQRQVPHERATRVPWIWATGRLGDETRTFIDAPFIATSLPPVTIP